MICLLITKCYCTRVQLRLIGLVNASLLIYTRTVLPDTASLPHFTTPRPLSRTSSVFSYFSSRHSGDDHADGTLGRGGYADDSDEKGGEWTRSRTPIGGVTPFILPPLIQVDSRESLDSDAESVKLSDEKAAEAATIVTVSTPAKPKSAIALPKPTLPRIHRSSPLFTDSERGHLFNREPLRVHVRKSVESFESVVVPTLPKKS